MEPPEGRLKTALRDFVPARGVELAALLIAERSVWDWHSGCAANLVLRDLSVSDSEDWDVRMLLVTAQRALL
jgi:hypothetical protein